MRRNHTFLTDRPDVLRTAFGLLEPPNGVFGTQERAYNFNDNVSRGFIVVRSSKKDNITMFRVAQYQLY